MILEITYGIGHFTMNHPRVLKQGLSGIAAEAERRYDALTPEERSGDKGLFYDAMIRSLRATVGFANRYAALAESLAASEANAERAEELRTIARVCRRVPEHPAQTFHEAVQSLYFVHLVAQIESGGNSISLGRIDQILYPYYVADRQAGRITPDQARELLSLLYLKTNEIWNILEEAFIPGGELHRAGRLRRRADGAAQLRRAAEPKGAPGLLPESHRIREGRRAAAPVQR
jgi:formate C-acetyltransferase